MAKSERGMEHGQLARFEREEVNLNQRAAARTAASTFSHCKQRLSLDLGSWEVRLKDRAKGRYDRQTANT